MVFFLQNNVVRIVKIIKVKLKHNMNSSMYKILFESMLKRILTRLPLNWCLGTDLAIEYCKMRVCLDN